MMWEKQLGSWSASSQLIWIYSVFGPWQVSQFAISIHLAILICTCSFSKFLSWKRIAYSLPTSEFGEKSLG